jgi:Zn-dependent M28 family amino/carboxypeptidase
VRIVLFTNEEHGLSGAMAYAAAHATEPHQGAIEADTGSGAPVGFRVDLRDPAAPDEASTGRVAAAIEAMAPTGPSLRNGDYRNLSRG